MLARASPPNSRPGRPSCRGDGGRSVDHVERAHAWRRRPVRIASGLPACAPRNGRENAAEAAEHPKAMMVCVRPIRPMVSGHHRRICRGRRGRLDPQGGLSRPNHAPPCTHQFSTPDGCAHTPCARCFASEATFCSDGLRHGFEKVAMNCRRRVRQDFCLVSLRTVETSSDSVHRARSSTPPAPATSSRPRTSWSHAAVAAAAPAEPLVYQTANTTASAGGRFLRPRSDFGIGIAHGWMLAMIARTIGPRITPVSPHDSRFDSLHPIASQRAALRARGSFASQTSTTSPPKVAAVTPDGSLPCCVGSSNTSEARIWSCAGPIADAIRRHHCCSPSLSTVGGIVLGARVALRRGGASAVLGPVPRRPWVEPVANTLHLLLVSRSRTPTVARWSTTRSAARCDPDRPQSRPVLTKTRRSTACAPARHYGGTRPYRVLDSRGLPTFPGAIR